MEMSGLTGGIFRFCEWLMRLAYANILWILFTLIGFIILGIMPATVAMFTLVRKWLRNEPDIPVFRTFFNTFKKEFITSNLFGLIFAATAYILYIDLQYLSIATGYLHTLLLSALVLTGTVFTLLLMNFFPVYVHYDLKFLQYMKYSVMIGITNLHYTIMMGLGLWLIYYFFMFIPGLLPFFSISVPAFFIMWIGMLAFHAIERKREKVLAKEAQPM